MALGPILKLMQSSNPSPLDKFDTRVEVGVYTIFGQRVFYHVPKEKRKEGSWQGSAKEGVWVGVSDRVSDGPQIILTLVVRDCNLYMSQE